jgi:hypothetical protein
LIVPQQHQQLCADDFTLVSLGYNEWIAEQVVIVVEASIKANFAGDIAHR